MGFINHSSNEHRLLTKPIIDQPKVLLSNHKHAKSESKSAKTTKKHSSIVPSESSEWHTIKNGRSYPASNIKILGPQPVTKFVTDTTIVAPKLYPRKTSPKQRTVKKPSKHHVWIISVDKSSAEIDRIKKLEVPINSYTSKNRSSSSVPTAIVDNQNNPGKSGQSKSGDGSPNDENDHPLDRSNNNNNDYDENDNAIANISNMDPSCMNTVEFTLKTNTYQRGRGNFQHVYQVVEAFCKQLFSKAKVGAIYPTNPHTHPKPHVISSVNQIPSNGYEFREFFRAEIVGKRTIVYFKAILDINILELKKTNV